MKTGLSKKQKTTNVYFFNEADSIVEVCTYNTALKNRLTEYAVKYPSECRLIDDDGNGSPRVIGKVSGGTESASEGGSSAEGNDTPDSQSSVSEGDSEHSGANPLAIIAGVAALAGVGGIGYYMTKKRK